MPVNPSVPHLAGVPSLPSNGLPFPAPGRILSTVLNLFLPERFEIWGIFDQNFNQVLMPDSFLEYSFNGGSTVAKFPVQSGSFADYNKVQHPDEIAVVMCKGGLDLYAQRDFIATIEAMKKSTALFTVLTPYSSNVNMNVVDYSYRNSVDNGSHMIIVELRIQEIRQVSSSYTTVKSTQNAKEPGAKPPVATGNAATVAPSVASQIAAKIAAGKSEILKALGL